MRRGRLGRRTKVLVIDDEAPTHDVRHTYGSHLVQQGLDPVRVSRRMGHARPSITLDVYAKEFEQAEHADDVAEKLAAAFGGVL